MQEDRYIIVAQLGKPYALLGWIKVNPFTQPISNLLDYAPWFYRRDNQWLPLAVDKKQIKGNSVTIHLEGYETPEAVSIWTGTEIAVKRSQLTKLKANEYFWCDLIGLEVETLAGVHLGKIDRLFSSGGTDVMVITGQKEQMIPFIQNHYVMKIDLAAGKMIVDWDPEFL